MKNGFLKYALFFVAASLVLILFHTSRPKPIDWSENFDVNKKSPFGLYILNKEIDKLISKPIYRIAENLYANEKDKTFDETKRSYLFINYNSKSALDPYSTTLLINKVKQGAQVVISSYNFNDSLAQVLGFETYTINKVAIQSVNNSLKSSIVTSDKTEIVYFTIKNKDSLEVLAHDSQNPIAIRRKIGKGEFIVHGAPILFTNYYLLESNYHRHAENMLSYINRDELHWYDANFDYVKEVNNQTPLRFILSNESLKWALYLFMFTMLIFVLFNSKRKQRIIPIIEPEQNKSLEFAKTIGDLHFQAKDYNDLIQKTITYFKEYIRNKLRIHIDFDHPLFVETFVNKTNANKEDVLQLLKFIEQFQQNPSHKFTAEDALKIYKLIEKLKK